MVEKKINHGGRINISITKRLTKGKEERKKISIEESKTRLVTNRESLKSLCKGQLLHLLTND